MGLRILGTALPFLLVLSAACQAQVDRQEERRKMLQDIRASVQRTASYTGRTELSEAVMGQMETVPRHEFVIPAQRERAYLNTALPIEHGQTISQPLIVALMTDFLEPASGHRVLEVGTGSGYQAAVLAGLVEQVYSIEIVPELAASAAEVLDRLGYDNVSVRAGDGYAGWPEAAPFDGIIVTAAPEEIPPALLEQLKPGGRLVIPLGAEGGYQELVLVRKLEDGSIEQSSILPVRFVPFTGEAQAR